MADNNFSIAGRQSAIIKVLIVEDSPVIQEFLRETLSSDPGISVTGIAGDGEEAVRAAAEKKPDVITMDIHMPKLDGIEATRRIMESNPVPIVIVSGNWNPEEVETTFKAMEAGAIAIVQRPAGVGHPDHGKTARELLQTVKLMSEVKVIRRRPPGKRAASVAFVKEPALAKKAQEIEIVAIGTSTGGPVALQTILAELPKDFPAPILIVQHIAKGFLPGMVDWLAATSAVPVHIAAHGQQIQVGHAYFAPDGGNMGLGKKGEISISLLGSESSPCPSASFLFRSVAERYGANAVGVLLTGMGSDGARELKLMKTKGAVTIVQDRESCVVFGMPAVAIDLGAATYVLPPDSIARTLSFLAGPEDRHDGRAADVKKASAHMLVIEDSPTQAEKLRHLLEENGYSVSTAGGGREALEMLRQQKPAIIISDIIMPEMDGYELCRRIKNDENLKDIPVILLTSLSDPADVLQGLECKADNFITKPYADSFLLSKVHNILANKESIPDEAQSGVEVVLSGKKFLITSRRRQIIDLLLSTYETAVKQKLELMTARDQLRDSNEQLKQKIEERTAALDDAKRAEEALRLSEERFRLAIMHSPVCVSNQDLNLRYTWQFNPQLAYNVDDVIGKTDLDVLPLETARHLVELKRRAIAAGSQVKDEIAIAKNGAMRFYTFAAEPLRDREGAIVGVANVIIDITEQVENRRKIEDLNRFLERRAAELAFANRELESFSYSISHDLRAPLRAMKGFSGILIKDHADKLNTEGREFLELIMTNADKMGELIDDILNLSRISRQEMTLQEIDLSAIAGSIVAGLMNSDPKRTVDVVIARGLKAHGDARLLTIALSNLIGNAWKYTGKTSAAKIELGVMEKSGETVCFVRDNGAGFDMAQAHRLFEPFQRLHAESQFPGTGIGLAIVNRIVQRHGGRIWGESETGKGATFYFTLPTTGT